MDKFKKSVFSAEVGRSRSRPYVPETINLTGWKWYYTVGTIVTFLGLVLYPVVVDPILHVDKYKKRHEEIQKELALVGMQPGQLRKFEDPWGKKKG